jgi:formylmethanofuran dehydrogenase subunit E
MEIPREYSVKDLARFHGHLGPYIVLGYRMGKSALTRLGSNPFAIQATVFCSGVTPQSCLADGVQLGSGCTLGKGNIEVIRSDTVSCTFSGASTRIRFTPFPLKSLDPQDPDYELRIENYAESLYHLPDDELFRTEEL